LAGVASLRILTLRILTLRGLLSGIFLRLSSGVWNLCRYARGRCEIGRWCRLLCRRRGKQTGNEKRSQNAEPDDCRPVSSSIYRTFQCPRGAGHTREKNTHFCSILHHSVDARLMRLGRERLCLAGGFREPLSPLFERPIATEKCCSRATAKASFPVKS
jgi:hypothetical protein